MSPPTFEGHPRTNIDGDAEEEDEEEDDDDK